MSTSLMENVNGKRYFVHAPTTSSINLIYNLEGKRKPQQPQWYSKYFSTTVNSQRIHVYVLYSTSLYCSVWCFRNLGFIWVNKKLTFSIPFNKRKNLLKFVIFNWSNWSNIVQSMRIPLYCGCVDFVRFCQRFRCIVSRHINGLRERPVAIHQ